ncbi:kinesin light chain-like protein [Leptolyngbya sp. Heron Island J]|uniref:tetratricopeptide repeat protein n=1 Tax=Leptolyngbya sp. Heron Island J TaxID=1385935 RepID=UPI0003B9743B|nr:tetratricopeptide repeat protein [Leptolyngbya sp. Heron Island J]ESA35977.1 kinesin light chain-like protein [Leptolyngbya sp. Heron Island J]
MLQLLIVGVVGVLAGLPRLVIGQTLTAYAEEETTNSTPTQQDESEETTNSAPVLQDESADTDDLTEFTVIGNLDDGDKTLRDGKYYDEFIYDGAESGDQITVDLSSSEFDTYLSLETEFPLICIPDPWGGVSCSGGDFLRVMDDNDSGIGNNARMILGFGGFFAGLEGKFSPYLDQKIIVTSAQPGESGSYTLTVQKTTPTDLEWKEAEQLEQEVIWLKDQGNFLAATPLAERALAIKETILEPEHLDIATSLERLAELYSALGNYREAESLYQRALEIQKNAQGTTSPDVATDLRSLAGLHRAQGNYREAEQLLQQVLEIQEKELGNMHPDVAVSLQTLADLYSALGNYYAAEPLVQRALNIQETRLGDEHPDVARSLRSLAGLYQAQGNYRDAEPLLQRALDIQKETLGDEHPDIARSLRSLAELYQAQGNYRDAEPLLRKALDIQETMLGSESPEVATNLHSLAELYSALGDYRKTESHLQRALEIREQALGTEHPDVAMNLHSLARLYQVQGEADRAMDVETRAISIDEKNIAIILAARSEAQQLAYLETLVGTLNGTVSLHLQGAPENPAAARLALTTILRRKGLILDTVTHGLQTLRQNLNPEDQSLLNQLTAKRSQLSDVLFRRWFTGGIHDRRMIAALQAEIDQLEATLARRSGEFRSQTQTVTLEPTFRPLKWHIDNNAFSQQSK